MFTAMTPSTRVQGRDSLEPLFQPSQPVFWHPQVPRKQRGPKRNADEGRVYKENKQAQTLATRWEGVGNRRWMGSGTYNRVDLKEKEAKMRGDA